MSDPVANSKYDAFISYSHGKDLVLAQALQHDLERFARPWYRPRTSRVFRDLTNLSAAPGLWSTIVHALNSSRWFVLMASPASASSAWVRKEVGWWTEHRDSTRILIALTDGTIVWGESDFDWSSTDALPPELSRAFVEEPVWVDLRMLRPSNTASITAATTPPDLGDVVAEFAAPIMNRDKDELIGKHIAERRRTRRLVGSVLVIMAVLIIVAAAGAVVARDQRDEAISQRAEAIRQKREADDQARVAISRAVAAASQDTAQSDRDLSLLLAVESLRSSPTLEARDSLLGALVEEPYVVQYLRGAPAAVTALGLSGDGSQLFSGHEDGRVLAWDLAEPRPTPTHLLTGVGSIRGLAVDRTGARLVVASDELGVVDMSRDDAPVHILAGPALSDALVLSVDGRLLVNTGCSPRTDGCFEGKVKVWDLDARRVVSSWVWNAGSVTSAAVSSDSKLVALGSYRGDVATIRLKTGEVDDFTGTAPHPDQVESLVFTADDHRLVSASGTATPIPENPSARAEPTVRTWNVKSGARVRDVTLPWQSEGANPFDIALAPDGKMIATAGDHTIVKLWDAQTGSLISEFPGHHSLVGDLVFSASGLQMVSGDQDGLLIRWATSPVIAAAGNRRWCGSLGDEDAQRRVQPRRNASGGRRLRGRPTVGPRDRNRCPGPGACAAAGSRELGVQSGRHHRDRRRCRRRRHRGSRQLQRYAWQRDGLGCSDRSAAHQPDTDGRVGVRGRVQPCWRPRGGRRWWSPGRRGRGVGGTHRPHVMEPAENAVRR